jgi:putative peptidoglycan lipid II flippase
VTAGGGTAETSPPRALLRSTLALLPFQLVLRGGEALLPLLLAGWFGHSRGTDAQLLFGKLFAFLGGAAVSAFQDSVYIPKLTAVIAANRSSGVHFASTLWARSLVTALGLGLALAGMLAAYLGPELGVGATAALAAGYVLWLPAMSSRALLVGTAHTLRSYRVYPASSGTGMLVALFTIWLLHERAGVLIVPLALALGEWISAGILLIFLRRLLQFPLWPALVRHAEVNKFGRLVLHEVAGATLTRINPFIDQLVASSAGSAGGGTLLNYGFDVASLPTSIAQAALFPPLVSDLAHLATTGRWREFRSTVAYACAGLSAALAVLCGAAFVFRSALVRLLFLHGAMTERGCAGIVEVLPYALLGAVPFGILLVLARAHVALQNTRIMVPLGILNAALNAGFNLMLFPAIGLRGIAPSLYCCRVQSAWLRVVPTELAPKSSGASCSRCEVSLMRFRFRS